MRWPSRPRLDPKAIHEAGYHDHSDIPEHPRAGGICIEEIRVSPTTLLRCPRNARRKLLALDHLPSGPTGMLDRARCEAPAGWRAWSAPRSASVLVASPTPLDRADPLKQPGPKPAGQDKLVVLYDAASLGCAIG